MRKPDAEHIRNMFKSKAVLQQQAELKSQYRRIYVNQPLPEELRFHGSDTPAITYPRNKIRTSKYTPLSFIPKNLFFQFTNIANSYFLFIVILGAFQIFGVPNPVLSAVPLIVIVVITAVRDGFEDYRRAISDLDLNNSPIHLLSGMPNANVVPDEKIGVWRKFKKRCSRFFFGKLQAKLLEREGGAADLDATLRRTSTVISDRRASTETRHTHRTSRSHHQLAESPLVDPALVAPADVKFKTRYWKDIHVGDYIRIRNNEEVPADVVIVSTSEFDTGTCYIETKNLDGETNLKMRKALACGEGMKHAQDLAKSQFWLEVEQPNANLYAMKGVVHFGDAQGQGQGQDQTEPITSDNVLLRGYSLRNTKWVLGLVVYTGPETKIMLNGGITPTKKSKIARELNLSVTINFVLVFVLCFVSGLVNGLFYDRRGTSRLAYEFKPYASTSVANGVVSFFVSLIIYQSLVPISLYISIEIIKTVQAIFIYSDVKMYYERLDYPCTPKSWSISDDLGQIEYIFSDKTGTLTQNVMEFKKCTINGRAYGNCYTEARMGMDKRAGVDVVARAQEMAALLATEKAAMCDVVQKEFRSPHFHPDRLTLISSAYVEDVVQGRGRGPTSQGACNERFMLALATCHTVVTERTGAAANATADALSDIDADLDTDIEFKAESPDETALVSVARDLGFVFVERNKRGIVLQQYDQAPREIRVRAIVPFTSARKRMSCVAEIDGAPVLFTKGADNVIYERLSRSTPREVVTQTALHLEEFAKEGLRTLCIAQRDIDPQWFEAWLQRYNTAQSSIADDRDAQIDAVVAEIEVDLTLLGGTAIEDRLQDMVPESISILGEAGIKLWVLTGDKVETAINIGFGCNLLNNTMKLLVITADADADEVASAPESVAASVDALLSKYLAEEFQMSGSDEELDAARAEHTTPDSNCGIIIDGASLAEIFDDTSNELQKKFLLLGKKCRSVMCCRVSPAQKAAVVKLVKTQLNVMTLAIGDGANDVAMIQAANVGVGIAGEEGRQAVMSSDYAIAQFRFLTRLLLVHGRWSYKRLAEMIPCFFYKNVSFTMTLFWFGIFNNFDGSYLFEYTYLMFYNLAFTSLPVIFLAFLDQDVTATVSLLTPQLYKSGILGLEWSQYKFVYYIADGAYQSVISFFFPYFMYHTGNFLSHKGLVLDHRYWMGLCVTHIAVVSNNLYVLLQQKRWDWLSVLIVSISILLVFFWTGVWSAGTIAQEFYKSGPQVYGSLMFWCSFFVGVLACLLPRFIWDTIRRLYFPRDIDIIRERVQMGDYKSYPDGYDPTNFADVEAHRELVKGLGGGGDAEKQDGENSSSSNSSAGRAENVQQQPQPHQPHSAAPAPATAPAPKRKGSVVNRLRSISKVMKPPAFHFTSHNSAAASAGVASDDIESIRASMIAAGQLNRSSLERVRTSHQVEGLTQAESLLERYSTRGSTSRP